VKNRRVLFRVFGAVLGVLLAAVAAACTGGDRGNPSASLPKITVDVQSDPIGRIRTRGTVVVGVKFDVPLFGLRDAASGQLSGFDIEIAGMVAEALFPDDPTAANRIRFVEAISKSRERLLQDRTVDVVISTYTISDARKELVDFAGPYYIAGQDILASAENVKSGRIRGVGDLNGKKVCSVAGSTSLTNLRKAAPGADSTLTFDKYSQCYDALRAGKVDAITTDDVILLGLRQRDPGRFTLTGNPFHTEPYGIGVHKGETQLRDLINKALSEAFTSGRWRAAFEKTIGTTGQAAPNPPQLDR
jgi:glutamate transport system substrate-binding protein